MGCKDLSKSSFLPSLTNIPREVNKIQFSAICEMKAHCNSLLPCDFCVEWYQTTFWPISGFQKMLSCKTKEEYLEGSNWTSHVHLLNIFKSSHFKLPQNFSSGFFKISKYKTHLRWIFRKERNMIHKRAKRCSNLPGEVIFNYSF
jgi:uncharacterized protein YcaQ